MGQWLTPDAPGTGFICRSLRIPNSEEHLAIVNGALLDLVYSRSFEQFGTETPVDTAELFRQMYDDYVVGVGCVIGTVFACVLLSPPIGSLACDGGIYDRVDYPELYALLEPFYIIDADTFFVPDLRGRIIAGTGTGPGLTAREIGDEFGEEAHALTVAESASHSHTDTGHTHVEGIAVPSVGAALLGVPIPSAIPGVGVTGAGSASLSSSGGDGSHNNIQPSTALNYAIWAR